MRSSCGFKFPSARPARLAQWRPIGQDSIEQDSIEQDAIDQDAIDQDAIDHPWIDGIIAQACLGITRPSAQPMLRSTGRAAMAGLVERKLADLGIILPKPATPIANYVGFVRSGNLLTVSGQLCLDAEGKLVAKGKLGAG